MAKDFKSFFAIQNWIVKELWQKKKNQPKKPTCTALLFVTMVIETDVISIVTKHYLSPCEIEGTMFLTKP